MTTSSGGCVRFADPANARYEMALPDGSHDLRVAKIAGYSPLGAAE